MTQAVTGMIGAGPLVDLGAAPGTTALFALGHQVFGYDSFFGPGLFVYGQAAAAHDPGRLVYSAFNMQMTDIPNTTNTGYSIYVARQVMAQGAYGWYQRSGGCPVQTANSIAAAAAFGIAAAGKAGTLANGKQILNGCVQKASTYAPTQTISQVSGSKKIRVTSTAGLFKGLAVTGTGVGTSAVIVTVDNENEITVDVASSATNTVTGTFTWTGFLFCYLDNAFVQGQVV